MELLIYPKTTRHSSDVISVDIKTAANNEKQVPKEWINDAGNDVTEAFIAYAQPLIIGEPDVNYKNGIPEYLNVSHLIK